MNFITKIFSFFTGNANHQKKGSQQSTPSSAAHDHSPNVGIDSALQVSTVWAGVTLWVDIIASLPLKTYLVDKDGDRVEARDERIYRILHDKPNKRQTSMQFWSQMILNLVLRGNAYAIIKRDARGECVALLPLSSDQVEVIISDDDSVIYVYHYDSKRYVFTEKEMLHIYGIGNGVIGLSPLDYMRSSVGLAISAQNHTNQTFRKDARRPGILMSDSILTPDQRKALKDNFGDIVTGGGKELYILEAQFKFEPLGMSPADIQLLESRQFSVQDLARWLGIPSVLINDNAETTNLGSSVTEVLQAFYKLRLRPKLELIEQIIQEKVLTPDQRSKGFTVEFNLDAFLRSSPKDRAEINAKNVQNGLRTRNECRKKDNLKPLPGGDVLTAQTNLAPVDKLPITSQSKGVPEEPIKQLGKKL